MKTPEERFRAKVLVTDGCWIWQGGRSTQGYGRFSIGYRTSNAMRFAYEFWVGPIPGGLCVCHRCDNRLCVRPDHLFLGTNEENLRDMWAKGRGHRPARKIRCKNGHEMSLASTYALILHDGKERRVCRICDAANRKAYRLRVRDREQCDLGY